MAEIRPFRGIRYNRELQRELGRLVTPPYDVIDAAAEEWYYNLHPYNIIHLELPRSAVGDKYEAAAQTLQRWLADDVLRRDDRPALYLYQQVFRGETGPVTRTGFIASLRAEPYEAGSVLPHEETIRGHKEDRLRLLRACHTNVSSIFGLYHDPDHAVDGPLLEVVKSTPPAVQFTFQGVVERLWAVYEEKLLAQTCELMRGRPIYIADGHHRYETAVEFGREMRDKGRTGFDRVMVTLVNLHDPGLVIYPTHRLVKGVAGLRVEELLARLERDFLIRPLSVKAEAVDELLAVLKTAGSEGHAFALYAGGGQGYVLQLKASRKPEELLTSEHSPEWRRLDVAVLHGLILEPYLGVTDLTRSRGENLAYTRDAREALAGVDKGTYQLAFLINPPRVEDVVRIAGNGEKMPQKSTFFYPKLVTGLVLHQLGE